MRCNYFAALSILFFLFSPTVNIQAQQSGGFGGYVSPGTSSADRNVQEMNGQNSGHIQDARNQGDQAAHPGSSRQVPSQTLPTQQPMRLPSGDNQAAGGGQAFGPSSGSVANQNSQSSNQQGGYVSTAVPNTPENAQHDQLENGEKVLPPPFELLSDEQTKLNEFLNRWETFGKGIKRLSCDVHVRDYDGGIFHQNSKIPMAHTWGEFRFIAPNKLSYHIRGEFVYIAPPAGGDPKPEWKASSNEKKIVFDGKNLVQYNFQKKEAHFFPIPEEESNYDLSMNKMFPLFFIANAQKLKQRYYMRIVTPAEHLNRDVWIEAFPRYASDQQLYRSLLILLRLSDLQPYYLRRMSQNGKSYSDLEFQSLSINKGLWNIEPSVDLGWSKKVEDPISLTGKETGSNDNNKK